MSTREAHQDKIIEGFMDMAGRMAQQVEETEALFQTALRMLDDLNSRPYTGDYETDYNRNSEVNDFIQQYKYVAPQTTANIGYAPTDDDLPF